MQYHITPRWAGWGLATCRRTLSEQKKNTLHVGCCAHLNVSTHIAASHKAGPRGGQVSSHVFANIGGLACPPSLRGAWRIGCHRAAIISELIITTLASSVA